MPGVHSHHVRAACPRQNDSACDARTLADVAANGLQSARHNGYHMPRIHSPGLSANHGLEVHDHEPVAIRLRAHALAQINLLAPFVAVFAFAWQLSVTRFAEIDSFQSILLTSSTSPITDH